MTTSTSKTPRRADGAGRRAARSRTRPSHSNAHLSVADRVARGKAARAEVPRASHAIFEPVGQRSDPIELLERQARRASPSWCRSATGGCSSPRSRSTAARR